MIRQIIFYTFLRNRRVHVSNKTAHKRIIAIISFQMWNMEVICHGMGSCVMVS